MSPDQKTVVKEYAEAASVYLAALVEFGVDPIHAVMLTSSYVSALIASVQSRPGKEPWQL